LARILHFLDRKQRAVFAIGSSLTGRPEPALPRSGSKSSETRERVGEHLLIDQPGREYGIEAQAK
jgi:hypothetical protein